MTEKKRQFKIRAFTAMMMLWSFVLETVSGGLGWKTIEQIAAELDVPIEKVLAILEEAGVEAKKTDVLRDAAERNGRKAYDLVNLIREKSGIQD